MDIVEVLNVGPGWNDVRLSDGQVYRLQGNYNWRSNNPGNIEWGDFARSQGAIAPGAVPPGRERPFAIFPSFDAGQRAREHLQFESPRYRDLTVRQAIERYAPSFENDVDAYVRTVTNAAGVSSDTLMSDLNAEQRAAFLHAQAAHEGWQEGDIYNEAGIRLPPGEIPNVVATATDTRRPNKAYAINDSGRLVDLSSGAVIPPSSPAAKSIAAGREAIGNERPPKIAPRPLMKQETMDRTLNLLADRLNPPMPVDPSLRPDAPPPPARALLPAIPPSTLAKVLKQPSASDRARGQTPASKRETIGQSRIETGAPRGLVDAIRGRNLGDDLAVSFIKGGAIDQPQEDAWYDAEQGAMRLKPTPTGEMPTLASVRAAFKLDPFKTASQPQTQVAQVSASDRARGQLPASQPDAQRQASAPQSVIDRVAPRIAMDGVGQGAGPFSKLTGLLGSKPAEQDPFFGVFRTGGPAGSVAMAEGARPSVIPDTTPSRTMSGPMDRVGNAPTWNAFQSKLVDLPMDNPMVAQIPRPAPDVRGLPQSFAAQDAQPAAPRFRTVMRDERVVNPDYTAWQAANGPGTGKIPLGDVYHGLSRDSMAQAAAGRNFAATMPAQWVTVKRPVQVRNNPVAPRQVAVPQAVAPQRPVVATLARPAPVRNGGLFGAITSGAGSTLGGLFGKLVGPNVNVGGMVQSGVNGVVGKVMADPMRLAMSMPPGAYLGPAANGGAMFRSHGGVANNLTQASDWWQVVTGQSDRSRGDGGAQSLSGTQN